MLGVRAAERDGVSDRVLVPAPVCPGQKASRCCWRSLLPDSILWVPGGGADVSLGGRFFQSWEVGLGGLWPWLCFSPLLWGRLTPSLLLELESGLLY